MKKPVIFTILCIYILSIVIVGVFGVKLTVHDQVVYQQKIVCRYMISDPDTYNLKYDDPDGTYYVSRNVSGKEIKYVDYKKDLKFSIFYDVYPDNANDKKVNLTLSNENMASIDKVNGIITFNDLEAAGFTKPYAIFVVYLKAVDGSNISTNITVTAKMPSHQTETTIEN